MALSPAQQKAVESAGHCMIVACAGSGKTTTLAARGGRLLRENAQARVVAVTFTAEAAGELRQRVIDKGPPQCSDRLIAGTFHRLAKQQLIASLREQGLPARLNLANGRQQSELMRRAHKLAAEEITPTRAEELVNYFKSYVDIPIATNQEETEGLNVLCAYEDLLSQRGLLDFQDLLLRAVRGMRDGSVKAIEADFLMVDEFQDTDRVQYEWVLAHAKSDIEVTVVGDDDQSIYGWRLALGYEGMSRFAADTAATRIDLDVTYRVPTEIIQSAKTLVEHNEDRLNKSLRSASPVRGKIFVKRAAHSEEEAWMLARAIDEDENCESWGILARSNRQLDEVEQALTRRSLAYRRVGGKSFWDSRGPSIFISVAQALATNSLAGLDPLLQSAGLKSGQLEELHENCHTKEPGSLQRFLDLDLLGNPPKKLVQLQATVTEWMEWIGENEYRHPLYGIADWMSSMLPKQMCPGSVEPCAKTLLKIRGSLAQRLRAVQEKATAGDCDITLMTMHSSKGLEFDGVWIIGCEQGVLPHSGAPEDEERRLFYVGMTRTRRQLVLSYSIESDQPSQFVSEAALELATATDPLRIAAA